MSLTRKANLALLATATAHFGTNLLAEEPTQLPPFNATSSYNPYVEAVNSQGSSQQRLITSQKAHIEFEDIVNSVPGFHNSDSGAASFGNVYSFRGSANTPFFGPSAFAVYVDGVPLLDARSLPEELGHVSSIQFLKGGQASRIGQNAVAGAIIISTPAPDAEKAVTKTTLEAGSDNLRAASVFTQNKIGDNGAAYSFYAYANRSDGFVNNLQDPNTRIGMKRHEGANLRIALPQFADWNTELLYSWNQSRDGEQAYTSINAPAFTTDKDFDGKTNSESDTFALKLNKTFDDIAVSWVSSYTDWELGPYTTLMEIFPGFSLDSDLGQQNQQWAHELTVASNYESTINWEFGGYYQNRDTGGQTTRGIPNVMTIEESEFSHDIENSALRFNSTIKLSNRLTTGMGLRWENTSQDLDRQAIVPAPARIKLPQSDDSLQGDAFLAMEVSENLSSSLRLFVTEKAGGFSTYTGKLEFIPFDPQRSRGIELNNEWINDEQTVGINLSLFHTIIDDYQIERSFTAEDYYVRNMGEVKSQGGEFLLWMQPTDQLNVQFSHAYTDATFETEPGVIGNQVPYVPQSSSRIDLTYQLNENFSCRTNWTYKSDIHYIETNDPRYNADSYTIGDFWIRYQREQMSLELGVRNLTDETYQSFINTGVNQAVHGNTRQSVVRLGYDF